MTVENTQCFISYTSSDGEGEFPTTFKFLENGHLVVVMSIDSVDYPLVLDVDYTVDGAGDPEPGGTVYLVSPPTDETFTLTIERRTPIIQPIAFTTNGPYSPTVVERQADRLIMIEQETRRRLEVLEALGDLVTTDAADGTRVEYEFLTGSTVEGSFPRSIPCTGGEAATDAWCTRLQNLDDSDEIFTENPSIQWRPSPDEDMIDLMSVDGLKPDTNYRIRLMVLF